MLFCLSIAVNVMSIKGKLGSDMGQPGILTGDTRVSHTQPSGSCGTPWYHQ